MQLMANNSASTSSFASNRISDTVDISRISPQRPYPNPTRFDYTEHINDDPLRIPTTVVRCGTIPIDRITKLAHMLTHI